MCDTLQGWTDIGYTNTNLFGYENHDDPDIVIGLKLVDENKQKLKVYLTEDKVHLILDRNKKIRFY